MNNPNFEVFFFDESRFGTHSKIGYGWFKKGSRTSIPCRLGFKSFYSYSAVSPKSGDDFSLLMPVVDTEAMNVFLSEMSVWLGSRNILLIMDRASWHKCKDLNIPGNIHIFYLPAYSPELNPVEKLWQYMKDNILKNRVYDLLEDLEDVVCQFIQGFDKETIKSVCNVNYMSYYL